MISSKEILTPSWEKVEEKRGDEIKTGGIQLC
jgi:hypothetical protein